MTLIYRLTGTEGTVSPFDVNAHIHTLARPPNCFPMLPMFRDIIRLLLDLGVSRLLVPRISELIAAHRHRRIDIRYFDDDFLPAAGA
jgi:hypothetical protein